MEEKMSEYVNDVISRFLKGGKELGAAETRFASKHVEYRDKAQKHYADIRQLENQIQQAQARIRSLEVQAAGDEGQAVSFLESIVALKFEDELPPVARPTAKQQELKVMDKGNGKEDLSAGTNRKTRRTKKAKAKKQAQPNT